MLSKQNLYSKKNIPHSIDNKVSVNGSKHYIYIYICYNNILQSGPITINGLPLKYNNVNVFPI